jgi:hypothetical protein
VRHVERSVKGVDVRSWRLDPARGKNKTLVSRRRISTSGLEPEGTDDTHTHVG